MKKFLMIVTLAALTLSVKAASVTYVLPPAGVTNSIVCPAKVTQFVIAANTTNASIAVIDAPALTINYTNAAYTNIVTYATNYVNTWVNFYGLTNSTTNVAIVDASQAVAATTNAYLTRFSASSLASTTTRYDSVNYYFNFGMMITNTSSGIATVTVTYQN